LGVLSAKTRSLLNLLHTRILAWREEIDLKTYSDLPKLQDALEMTEESQIEPDLFILVVAMCEWWFRVYHPTPIQVETVLITRLSSPGPKPFGGPVKCTPQISEVPQAVESYVDQRLRKLMENEGSGELSRFAQLILKPRIDELVKEYAVPFLVPERRVLPAKPGGYAWWAPWVTASAIYQAVKTQYPRRQDSRALDTAMACLEGLLGRMPETTQFHTYRRDIDRRAPKLVEALWNDFGTRLKAYPDPYQRLEFHLERGLFDSLDTSGGIDLLVGSKMVL
jgi:hypothetical protein